MGKGGGKCDCHCDRKFPSSQSYDRDEKKSLAAPLPLGSPDNVISGDGRMKRLPGSPFIAGFWMIPRVDAGHWTSRALCYMAKWCVFDRNYDSSDAPPVHNNSHSSAQAKHPEMKVGPS